MLFTSNYLIKIEKKKKKAKKQDDEDQSSEEINEYEEDDLEMMERIEEESEICSNFIELNFTR